MTTLHNRNIVRGLQIILSSPIRQKFYLPQDSPQQKSCSAAQLQTAPRQPTDHHITYRDMKYYPLHYISGTLAENSIGHCYISFHNTSFPYFLLHYFPVLHVIKWYTGLQLSQGYKNFPILKFLKFKIIWNSLVVECKILCYFCVHVPHFRLFFARDLLLYSMLYIEAIHDNVINFLYVLSYLLGMAAWFCFFPQGVLRIPSVWAFMSYLFLVTMWTLCYIRQQENFI